MEYLKIVLINMIAILITSANFPTPGLLQIKIYFNKFYDVIIYAHGVITKVLLHGSNFFEYVIMRPKFWWLKGLYEKLS